MANRKTQNESSRRHLVRLAERYRVQTQYRDALGRVREPSAESLLDTLRALGADVNSPADLEAAGHRRDADLWRRMIEPVVVAWEGQWPGLMLRVRSGGRRNVRLTLTLEDGTSFSGEAVLDDTGAVATAYVDGARYAAIPLRARQVRSAVGRGLGRLPWGYHRLRVETGGCGAEALLIATPRRCWRVAEDDAAGAVSGAALAGVPPLDRLAGKPWALFAPVYALRSARDHGAGDLADLQALMAWTGKVGGSLVATLPLLASNLAAKADPSPYRPLSRLFWNEFFLAPEFLPEWPMCPEARTLASEASFRTADERLRASDIVDYHAVMEHKRPVLEALARSFSERAGDARRSEFEAYLRENPLAADYAVFRTGGGLPGAAREGTTQYHLYCQWQMDRQLSTLGSSRGPGLLFDLPLGVHPRGFDVARWPAVFARGISSGAPPDTFFAKGQDWNTPPLNPWADRQEGYGYFRACLRNLMRPAAALRIDHVMSLHRLFWIPEDREPSDGAYVRHPAEELYAVLSCESHRHHTEVIGEDLGTVPEGVRAGMRRHAVARTWICLGSLRPRAENVMAPVPADCLVTLETHDMVPLAGFLHGDDIETRVETGQLDPWRARREAAARRRLVARLEATFGVSGAGPDVAAPAILAGGFAAMARSAARVVLVNLEDLLLERRPQNVPGTGAERPNWRRKIAVCIEDLPGYSDARR